MHQLLQVLPQNKKMAKSKKTVTRNQNRQDNTYLDKIENEIKSNQSTLSLVLGVLIVLVLGVLLFNYFSKSKTTPENTDQATENASPSDVAPDSLPGKYTVKEGDTLFVIAEKYYKDGYKYSDLAKANSLQNENTITVGQVLDIPKMDDTSTAQASASPQASDVAMANPTDSPSPTTEPQASANVEPVKGAVGGASNTTIWGDKIESTTYTVVAGDWLSTISARAYGDIYSYDKIAKANNISNPDVIEPGTVLQIPR